MNILQILKEMVKKIVDIFLKNTNIFKFMNIFSKSRTFFQIHEFLKKLINILKFIKICKVCEHFLFQQLTKNIFFFLSEHPTKERAQKMTQRAERAV